MTPRARKLLLTAHVTCSVGWFGAVAAYLVPAFVGLTSIDPERVRAAWQLMALLGWWVLVPLALGSLVTGIAQSLATEWGLLRHYWIAAKLALTLLGTFVLLGHLVRRVSGAALLVSADAFTRSDFQLLRLQLVVHAAGGLLLLLATIALSIFKPW
ncbi:MAG: hypothetical protein ACK4N5_02740, partial [Myxococcales bacterium]